MGGQPQTYFFIEILPILGGQTEFGHELSDQKVILFQTND
jgi:hypothetical protein